MRALATSKEQMFPKTNFDYSDIIKNELIKS